VGKVNSMKFRWRRIPYYLSALAQILPKTDWLNKEIVINGIKLRFAKYTDLLEIKEVILDQEYDNETVKLDDKDRVVVDIGAGVGDFTIMAAKRYPDSVIYAYEPDDNRFKLFEINLALNGIENVKSIKQAVTSLNRKIDFLKIDCEGGEYDLLKNIKKVNKIAMELHLNYGDGEKLLKNLVDSGFKVETSKMSDVPELMHVFARKQ